MLEFNIDVKFINSQTISKTFLGLVFNINYLDTNIEIQIEPFQNFQNLKDSIDLKLAKSIEKLAKNNLNLEDNSIIKYIEKTEFFREKIKKRIKLYYKKIYRIYPNLYGNLRFLNLKILLKDIKENIRQYLISDLTKKTLLI